MFRIYTKELRDEMYLLKAQVLKYEDIVERGKEAIAILNEEVAGLLQSEHRLKEEYCRKEEHATALLTIQQEKEIHRQVSKVKEEYNRKEKDLLESNFQKLGDSLEELHKKGNANTKFVERTSLKMMDVMAQLAGTKLTNMPPVLEAPEEVEEKKRFKTINSVKREIFHCDIEDRDWYYDKDGDECWVD